MPRAAKRAAEVACGHLARGDEAGILDHLERRRHRAGASGAGVVVGHEALSRTNTVGRWS